MGNKLKVENPILNNPAMKFIGKETIEKVDGIVETTESVPTVTSTPISTATTVPKEEPEHTTAPAVEETKRGPGRPKVTTKKKQYTVTLKKELYDEAMLAAERMGISFSALATNALNEYLNK